MNGCLEIRAGRKALAHILEKGLSPSDIRAVLGASGAAKWLGIYGLYRAIFETWLRDVSHPVFLFGTSIGAWTLAAGAQRRPGQAFDRLKAAYIRQAYRGPVTPEKVGQVSMRILKEVFPLDQVRQILTHPRLKLGFSAVRCKGPMASEQPGLLTLGLLAGFGTNLVSRRTQGLFFERTLFHVPHNPPFPLNLSGFAVNRVMLSPDNFLEALLASGSIPLVMQGIRNIDGAPEGIYRDGGILDYHPVLPLTGPGLILYPHFYPYLFPGWFDKSLAWRRARGKVLDRTILLSPSRAFVQELPFARIPDRKDFLRFQGQDIDRFRAWDRAASMSRILGEAFLDAVSGDRIRSLVQPL